MSFFIGILWKVAKRLNLALIALGVKSFKAKHSASVLGFLLWIMLCSFFSTYMLPSYVSERGVEYHTRVGHLNTYLRQQKSYYKPYNASSTEPSPSSSSTLLPLSSKIFVLNSSSVTTLKPTGSLRADDSMTTNDSMATNDSMVVRDAMNINKALKVLSSSDISNVNADLQDLLNLWRSLDKMFESETPLVTKPQSPKFNASSMNSINNSFNSNDNSMGSNNDSANPDSSLTLYRDEAVIANYGLKPCMDHEQAKLPEYKPFGYLMVVCNGGLNQQRAAVCNAAVIARLLNLSLLIPHLQPNPVWQDFSDFEDVFNVDRFIYKLRGIVDVVRSLPSRVLARKSIDFRDIPTDHDASLEWYRESVSEAIRKQIHHSQFKQTIARIPPLVVLDPFARRLSHDLTPEWQQLRCRVNYQALDFSPELKKLGNYMVKKMKKFSEKYVVLHLRYEIDALSYSMCDYGGGEKERKLFEQYRIRHWGSMKQDLREKLDPREQRRRGQCPLTPREATLFMNAMGIKNNSYVYLATLEDNLYGGIKSLRPIKRAFPHLITKKALLPQTELRKFEGKASSLAALDYMMSVESYIYVPTATGQFTNMVLGERIYRGHRRSYQPDLNLVAHALSGFNGTNWNRVKKRIFKGHRKRMGKPLMRAPFRNFYSNPRECLCRAHKASPRPTSRLHGRAY